MSAFKLDDLLKIGSETLQTIAQTLSGAVNELKAAVDAKSTVSVSSAGSASSTDYRYQRVSVVTAGTTGSYPIDGTKYMEQSVTLDASDPTIVTFTNATIAANSVIDVFVSKWDCVPENVSCASGTCVVTLPADEDESTVTVRIYIRME